jgi:hypothetical protein
MGSVSNNTILTGISTTRVESVFDVAWFGARKAESI